MSIQRKRIMHPTHSSDWNLKRYFNPQAQKGQNVNLPQNSFPRRLTVAITFFTMMLLFGFQTVVLAETEIYRSLKSIRALSPDDAPGNVVDFEATVTYVSSMRDFIFVQDGQDAIFVHRPTFSSIEPNQRVRIQGRLAKGDLLPIVSDPVVTVVGEGSPPAIEDVAVIGVEHDCRLLQFEYEILQTTEGATETFLYAKTSNDEGVCIAVQHHEDAFLPDVSRFAGNRIRCTGVLGLLIEGFAFRKPGELGCNIVGYKIFCSSPKDIQIVKQKNKLDDFKSAQEVDLALLKRDDFKEGRFVSFAQICMVEQSSPKGFVISDGSNFKRFDLHSTDGLKAGMVVRVGGKKIIDSNGQPRFEVDYLRQLPLSEFPSLEVNSVQAAAADFAPDCRISIEGTPLHVENRANGPHLILEDSGTTVAVQFQDAAADVLASLDPSIARKVRVTGVTKADDKHDFKIVVALHGDARLIEKKASLSSILLPGLASLLGVCAMAAVWIKVLKSQVAQKQRFESIFDNAGCSIFVFNGNLEIVDANQLAADLTGYSKDQLRNMSFLEVDQNSPEEQFKENLLRAMNTREVAVFPTKIKNLDSSQQEVEVHCKNLIASDDTSKATYIAIVSDISARLKYENELKEARDEAIKANKAKSQFVAAMSHELRTPLNGVIGMTQLLQTTELTPTQSDYLAACKSSGETLLTVIGDVLDFSKMEASKMELDSQKTDLIPFVENVVRASNLQLGTRHVDLASFVDPRLSKSVMVDADRLRQVLFNVIGNAIKFTSEGSVTVSAVCTAVNDQFADIRFVVSDTGIGMPQEKIDLLFEPFEQCDSSTTRQYGGTGLGLTICRQIVELMDGRIYAQSIEGKGSDFVFEIRLPFAAENTICNEGKTEIIPTRQRLAVVGVEEPIEKTLSEMFAAYQVDVAFFSETDRLPENQFDVVLLNNSCDAESVGRYINQQPAFSDAGAPVVIPVVPPNCVIEQHEWEIQGAMPPIFKPFNQTRFLQPLVSGQHAQQQPVTEHLPAHELAGRALRILICEDTTVNQMVVKEICRSAGIEVVICDNGQVGIDKLVNDSEFDVIFMDCHMPVLDGFEAAKKIQEMVQQGSIEKIPVIALTANALASDREKCLEAGMDDYLAKPFVIDDFLEKIHAHTKKRSNQGSAKVHPTHVSDQSHSGTPVFDIENLTDQFDNRDFALDIASQFITTFPEYRAELAVCLNQQNLEQTVCLAHRLKGSAATVKADRIFSLAFEIESAAKKDQLEQIQSQVNELLSEFDKFTDAVSNEKAAT